MIYMDYAATSPMSKEALAIFIEANEDFYGNASSLHDIGSQASQALDICRGEIASLLNGHKDGVYFTSGGTESNTLAIRSLLEGNRRGGKHILTTEIEHSSVYHLFKKLEQEGYEATYVPVDEYGLVDLDRLKAAIRPDTVLASIQHANSEIGTVQPIEKIGAILHDEDVLFHSDCVQTFGKLPIDVEACKMDSVSLSAHKISGPKGVGACYINPKAAWKPQSEGTTHEKGFRPGTVNVPGILSFTAAAQSAVENISDRTEMYENLRHRFVSGLKERDIAFQLHGHTKWRLPNVIGLSFPNIQGQYIMLECNQRGLAISTGSACQIGQQHPSRTMLAIGKSDQEAKELIRLSFGPATTEQEVDEALEILRDIETGSSSL